jgi:hypothetical protein
MMKYIFTILLFFSSFKTFSQAQELQQLALDLEKLTQFKQILTDLEKGYAILEGGYNTIKDISQGNFNLHKDFLDGLLAISPAVAKYARIADIISMQLQLVKEYKSYYNRFKKDTHFTVDEVTYIGNVYTNLFNESLKNLDALLNVITAGKLRMSDDERMHSIDGIYLDMKDKLVFLRNFNNSTSLLSIQRQKEQEDIDVMRNLYELK